jgi:hypothetical protein
MTELLHALSELIPLLWPVVVVLVILLFRKEIGGLINRIDKATGPFGFGVSVAPPSQNPDAIKEPGSSAPPSIPNPHQIRQQADELIQGIRVNSTGRCNTL